MNKIDLGVVVDNSGKIMPNAEIFNIETPYSFDVEDGHLILKYSGDNPPNFYIGEDGHLYLEVEEDESPDLFVSYVFYKKNYLGNKINEDDFPYLSDRAYDYVYAQTKGIIDIVTGRALEMGKKAVCAIAEVIQNEDYAASKRTDGNGGVVSSESVGSWSKSYATGMNVSEAEYMGKRKRELLKLYLGTVPEFASIFRVTSYRCVHETRMCR